MSSEAHLQIICAWCTATRILQINFLDHVIVGQAMVGAAGFLQFPGNRPFGVRRGEGGQEMMLFEPLHTPKHLASGKPLVKYEV